MIEKELGFGFECLMYGNMGYRFLYTQKVNPIIEEEEPYNNSIACFRQLSTSGIYAIRFCFHSECEI